MMTWWPVLVAAAATASGGWRDHVGVVGLQLALGLVPILAFEASYRRWRPWAVEALGVEAHDPPMTYIWGSAVAAELTMLAVNCTHLPNWWQLTLLRLPFLLVQLAQVGRFSLETDRTHGTD